ncbi:MAG: alpha/beta fold hydrolase [Planctomycetota bacterium]
MGTVWRVLSFGAVLGASAIVVGVVYFVFHHVRLVVNLFLGVQIKTVPEEGVVAEGEKVFFETKDGVRLSGVLVAARSDREPVGTVVFNHEFGSDRNSCMKYADFLLDAGFQVFAFDYRHHGESGQLGDYEPRHWCTEYEIADLEAALAYLEGRADVDPERVVLFGISRGATTCLCVAATRPRIAAVVSDSAFSTYRTLNDYMHKWVSIFVIRFLVFERVPELLFKVCGRGALLVSRFRLGVDFPAVERLVANCLMPILYIHGRRDSHIDWQQAPCLAQRTGGPHRVWIVPEARHNRSRFVEPERYERIVTGFLQEALAHKGTGAGVRERTYA